MPSAAVATASQRKSRFVPELELNSSIHFTSPAVWSERISHAKTYTAALLATGHP